MQINGEYNEAGVYEVTAKFCHFEKDTAIKLINTLLWQENPENEPRPVDED